MHEFVIIFAASAGTGDGKPVSKSDLEEDEDAADEGNESPR